VLHDDSAGWLDLYRAIVDSGLQGPVGSCSGPAANLNASFGVFMRSTADAADVKLDQVSDRAHRALPALEAMTVPQRSLIVRIARSTIQFRAGLDDSRSSP